MTRPAWLVPSLLALTSCTAVIAAPDEGQLPPPGAIKSVALPMPMGLQIQQNRPTSTRPGILAVTPGSNVIFLNFDGQALRPGQCSDSATGCTFITTVSTNFPAFSGTAAQKDQIVNLVRGYFARYNVTITTTRPTGVYTMCMIGGSPQNIGMDPGAAGVAPLDCGDTSGADIVFAFSEVTQNEPNAIATTVAQEVAHAYGLGHTNVQADIMYPYLNNATTGFLDQTMTTPDQSFCPGVASQNSHRDMVRMLGAATGGTAGTGGAGAGGAGAGGAGGTDAPPRVAFTAPGDNATVPTEFQLNIDASDDRGVQYVDLYLDRGTPGEQTARLLAAPFSARVTNLPAGRHTLDAIATDTGGHNASARVTVNVGGGAAGSTGTAGTGGGTAGAGGGAAGAGGGTAGGAGGGTAGGAGGGTAGAGGGTAGGTAGGAAGGTAPTPGAGGQSGSTPKGMGESCLGPVDCASGICLNDRANSRQYCSRDCADGMCPVGAECVNVETVKACVFKAAPAGAAGSGATTTGAEMHLVGNCAAAPGGATRGGLALLLPLLLFLRRRRAR